MKYLIGATITMALMLAALLACPDVYVQHEGKYILVQFGSTTIEIDRPIKIAAIDED